MIAGFISAWRTLTAIPVPGKGPQNWADALPWFPIIGTILGLLLWGCAAAAAATLRVPWPELAAFVVVAGQLLLTRGLHLDGLADCADAFGSMAGKDRALEILKDSRIGVFGAAAVVTILLAKWIAVLRLAQSGMLIALVPAYVLSRTMQVELAVCLPYARSEGGTAASLVAEARPKHRWLAHAIAFVIVAGFLGYRVLPAYALAWAVCRLAGYFSRRRIGGVTGDVLGAGSELVETTLLLFLASTVPGS